jgi:hypothetical protein
LAQTLPLNLSHGLPILEIGAARMLLDTGCPFTFGRVPALEVFGGWRVMAGPEGIGPFNLGAVQRLTGPEVDGLAGMDLLGNNVWTLDLEAGTAVIDDQGLPCAAGSLAFTRLLGNGTPVAEVIYRGRRERAILDTGARYSYRIGERPADLLAGAEVEDFSPFLGPFRTPLWRDAVQLAGLTLPVGFGEVPEQGQDHFRRLRCPWLIGMDLLQAFKVRFDFRKNQLSLELHDY